MIFFALSCRILVFLFASYNLAIGATLIVTAPYICMIYAVIYCFQHPREYLINRNTKYLLFLFSIYSIYCLVYTFILKKVPIEQLSKVPDSPIEMIRDTISLGVLMALACMYKEKIYYELFAKLSVIIIVFSLLFYFSQVGYASYAYMRTLKGSDSDIYSESMNILSGLALGGYIGTAYICNLWLIDKWTQSRPINWIIFIVVSCFLLFVLLILGERGPVIFTIITTIWFFLVRSKNNGRRSGIVFFLILLAFFMGDHITRIVSRFAPVIVERFLAISDDMGSGRFGANSIYSETVNMILENPILGNYFRLTTNDFRGLYPHNIILEFLVTCGLLFSIPLFVLITKAIKNARIAISNDDPMALFGLLFFQSFCFLLTSGSVLLNTKFWIMFAASLCISPKKEI